MLNLRKIAAAFTMALLFSTASFANSSYPSEAEEVLVVNAIQDVVAQNPSPEDELMFECCGTCTISINLLIFEFSYEWCCNECKEEQN